MKHIFWAPAVLLLLQGFTVEPLISQQPAAQETSSDAQAAMDKLTAEFKAANEKFGAAMKEVQASDEFKAARKERDRDAMNKLTKTVEPVDTKPFFAQAQSMAKKYAGKEDAVGFLVWLTINGGKKVATKSAGTLMNKHVKSEKLIALCEDGRRIMRTLGEEPCMEMIETLEKKSPHPEVKAHAIYLAHQLKSRGMSDEDKAASEMRVAKAAKMVDGTPLADRMRAPFFEKDRLQIGMEAPDITANDLDGEEFSLSDYRGKVVVIDFWGDW